MTTYLNLNKTTEKEMADIPNPSDTLTSGIQANQNSMSQLSSQFAEKQRRAQPLSDANKQIMDRTINGEPDSDENGGPPDGDSDDSQVIQILKTAGYKDVEIGQIVDALKTGKLTAGELKNHIQQKLADGTIANQQKQVAVIEGAQQNVPIGNSEIPYQPNETVVMVPPQSEANAKPNVQQPQQPQQVQTSTTPAQAPLNNENRVQPTVVPATEQPTEANSGTITGQAIDAASKMLAGGMPRNDIQAPQLGAQQMPNELSNYSIADKMRNEPASGSFKDKGSKKAKRIDFSKMTVGDAEDFSRNIAPTYNAQGGRENKAQIEAAKLEAKKEDLKYKAQLQDANNQVKVGIAKLNASNRRDLADQHAQLIANVNESTADSKDKAIMAHMIEDIIDNNADAEKALGILRGRNGKLDEYAAGIEIAKLYQKMLGSSQRLEASLASSVWFGSSPLIQKEYRNQNLDSNAQSKVLLMMMEAFLRKTFGDISGPNFTGILRGGVPVPGVNPAVPAPKNIPGTSAHIDTSTTPALGEGKLKNPVVPTIPQPTTTEEQ